LVAADVQRFLPWKIRRRPVLRLLFISAATQRDSAQRARRYDFKNIPKNHKQFLPLKVVVRQAWLLA
jgi:hypothetical protein